MRTVWLALTLTPLFLKADPVDPLPLARWGTKSPTNTYLLGEIIFFQPALTELVETTQSNYNNFCHKFKPGVRLTLGRNTSYDGWNTALAYTGWRYKQVHQALFDTSFLKAQGPLSYVYTLDQANLDLGRFCAVSKHLMLRPHTGLRALWLRQKGSLNFHRSKLTSALYGLQGGLDIVWACPYQLCLYAKVDLSCCVTHQQAFYTSPLLYQNCQNGLTLVNGVDTALGLQWDLNFAHDSYHFALNVGYEQHSLLHLNTSPSLTTTHGLINNPNFNLEGLNLGARLDF
jgi:hypothetical protein